VVADFGKQAGAFIFRIKRSKKNIHAELPDPEEGRHYVPWEPHTEQKLTSQKT
jgi:hypothetical protein